MRGMLGRAGVVTMVTAILEHTAPHPSTGVVVLWILGASLFVVFGINDEGDV